jgi:16S rRNA (guanine(966)-N(2))-methyltransferase RsmD
LQSLPGLDLRPTSDRLRESLFNVLSAAHALEGSTWVDLFAGTGAVGLEALSRGASQVYFVESERKHARLVRDNLAALGISAGYELLEQDAGRALRMLEERSVACDFCFFDPPYRMRGLYERTLKQLSESSLLQAGAIVIAEHEKKFDPGEGFAPLKRYRRLDQGDAALSFYRREE